MAVAGDMRAFIGDGRSSITLRWGLETRLDWWWWYYLVSSCISLLQTHVCLCRHREREGESDGLFSILLRLDSSPFLITLHFPSPSARSASAQLPISLRVTPTNRSRGHKAKKHFHMATGRLELFSVHKMLYAVR